METLQQHSASIFLWAIVSLISLRHLYVNWKIFKLSYRVVSAISTFILLPLLMLSVWSNVSYIIFILFSVVSSYAKVYKSRIERSSLKEKIDDRFLLFSYPVQEVFENTSAYRLKVFMWHSGHDILALVAVCIVGEIVDNAVIIIELLKLLF